MGILLDVVYPWWTYIILKMKNKRGIKMNSNNRKKNIITASIIGILSNIILAVVKIIIGTMASSISIVLTAVNNISDALSSIITITATKYAGKRPDKSHPFGYGRIEYVSALTISIIITYVGVTAVVESVKELMDPSTPDYTSTTLLVMAITGIIKIVMSIYTQKVGRENDSGSLIASGIEARMDAFVSFSIIIAALIYMKWRVQLDALLGLIIAIMLVYSSIIIMKETISKILGQRVSVDLVKDIKRSICELDDVDGVYDLVLNNYGPNSYIGSLHIEVPDFWTADRIDALSRKIAGKVHKEYGIVVSAIGIYSVNTSDDFASEVKKDIESIVDRYEGALQMHGFYLSKKNMSMSFDVVMDFSSKDRGEEFNRLCHEIRSKYSDYEITITMDIDAS